MKRLVTFSVVLALSCVLLLTGCERDSGVITITMASPSNPEDNTVRAFFHFRDIVEERSEGRIRVNVMHSGQLGGPRETVEQMQMGVLEIAEVNVAIFSAFDPRFMVFDLPYVSRGVDHLRGLLDGGLGQYFSDSLEDRTGVKILGWIIRSPRNMYISSRPVHTAADFAGMRVRIMESPVHHRTFELLGAVPVPIAATERYMALQTGVVDAAENSIPLIITQREYEVTRYLSRTEHFMTPNTIAMSASFFHGLPEDLQQILVEAADEAGRYGTMLDMEEEEEAIQELVRRGMVFNDVPDRSSFIQAVSPIFAEFRDQIGGDLIDAFTR
ncbi:MAG: TRAP transporter substrate-binding protein [Treponema sp.]|nr:TRAP transporter substrate-binding protein [Treponema sp.]